MSVHYHEQHVPEGQGTHENENKLYIQWTFQGFDETFALLWCEATDKRLAFDMWLITKPLFGGVLTSGYGTLIRDSVCELLERLQKQFDWTEGKAMRWGSADVYNGKFVICAF